MDPEANLAEQRELRRRILSSEVFDASDAARLAELSEAMDEWLSRGGFLPKDWGRGD